MAIKDKQYIFSKIDLIELKTKTMIQDIPELAESMKSWQDNKLLNSFFNETLNKYLDSLSDDTTIRGL